MKLIIDTYIDACKRFPIKDTVETLLNESLFTIIEELPDYSYDRVYVDNWDNSLILHTLYSKMRVRKLEDCLIGKGIYYDTRLTSMCGLEFSYKRKGINVIIYFHNENDSQ